ncbi:hypothetical protein RhiirB3_533169 [Rhizophagus irregularis]|nr:hypothetical protein RhiirB3_533169 [Rhizophagus irregularis]
MYPKKENCLAEHETMPTPRIRTKSGHQFGRKNLLSKVPSGVKRLGVKKENFDIAMDQCIGKVLCEPEVSSKIEEFEESGTEEFERSSIEKFEESGTGESKGISNKLKY